MPLRLNLIYEITFSLYHVWFVNRTEVIHILILYNVWLVGFKCCIIVIHVLIIQCSVVF